MPRGHACCCALLASLPQLVSAGPWVRDLGDGYVRVGYSHFAAKRGFVFGQETPFAYRSDALDTYAEIGLPFSTQLVFSLPYMRAVHSSSDGSRRFVHAWTGDLRVELDYALVPEFPLAVGVEARLPTYRAPSDIALDNPETTLEAASFPELGDRSVDLTVKILIGHSFEKNPGWVTLEAGPRIRFGGFSSGLFAAANVGLWVYRRSFGVNLYANANFNITDEPIPTKEVFYAQLSLLVQDLWYPGMGASLFAGTILAARNASTGENFGAAMTYQF